MARKYEQKKRVEKSFKAYKERYDYWKKRGYALIEEMSFDDYKDFYKKASFANKKNIARQAADKSRLITTEESKKLFKGVSELKGLGEEIPFKSAMDIRKNILKYSYSIGDTQFTGLQALYINLKYTLGKDDADEYFGYQS